jgi:hypothetical protein
MKPFSSVIASVILAIVMAADGDPPVVAAPPKKKKNGEKEIKCPILECTSDPGKDQRGESYCYVHDGLGATAKIMAKLCYDERTATVQDAPKYCPFDASNGKYMWINEEL